MIARRLSEPPPSVRRSRPTIPEGVDQAIQRALVPVPADRFPSAAELARALQAPGATQAPTAATVEAAPATPPAAPPPPPRSDTRHRRPVPVLAITLIAGFLLGLGVLFAWRHSRDGGDAASGTGPRVLAVLPFENLGDSTTEYFADGITDAVRGKLSSLPGLQVIASSSSNEYKDSGKPLPVIARELEADYLLVARIRWAKAADGSSRVKVSPELVDVGQSGAPKVKWQQPFDAEITDVFTVQADIADQVADALDLALGTGQKRTLTERPTANLAAYDAFLKGEASGGLDRRDPQSLRHAINYYEQAVALDSTFAAAWAALGRAHGAFYYNVMPTPTAAAAAKTATDRAIALAPGRPEGWFALCEYNQTVEVNYTRALEACGKGLALTPENAELLASAALAEQGLGRWDAAVQSLERARRLDPRSATTARRLAHTLLRLRRYPQALAAAERGLAVAPDNLDLIENKAMVYLAQGDLDGARRVVAEAPPSVEPTALVTFFGNYWDLFWALDDSHQRLLLRLPPSAFDGDRGAWGLVRAQTHFVRGDTAMARAYADSARLGFEQTLADNPDDPQRRILRGLALAYGGRKAEAIREGERGLALLSPADDGYTGPYLKHQIVRIYILSGDQEKALELLEPLLREPYYLSPGWLRIDPTFDALRGNPRFVTLSEAKGR
jgi:serine/threonine-protein kinase